MDVMDIARLSTAMSAAKASTEISMKVYKMALDQMKDVGDMVSALTAVSSAPVSIDPSVGQNLDVSV
jgi:hypothetical protein